MSESAYPILSVCATVGSRLSELVIENGKLIFVQDKHRIALDYNGKRVFYNQIEELKTEQDRTSLLAPIVGQYYFIIETAVLWAFQNGWVQVTSPPDEIVFIGTEMPELGVATTLYVDKTNKKIRVWDENLGGYVIVADKTEIDTISSDEINALFA